MRIIPYVPFPKSIAKVNLNQGYAIGCLYSYVCDEQKSLLFQKAYIPEYTTNVSKVKKKQTAKNYFKAICLMRFVSDDSEYYEYEIDVLVADYFSMSLELKEKIVIPCSRKALEKLHDEITIRYNSKKRVSKKKIILPETPLKYLKMPIEYTLLNTNGSLVLEGVLQHNCVAGYEYKIAKGKCVIYSAAINDERVTIEIVIKKSRNKFNMYVAQCYAKYNARCSEDTLKKVMSDLDAAKEQAILTFLKKENKNGTSTKANKNRNQNH